MERDIPPEVLDYYKKLKNEGFKAYFVGGCVRSLLLGIQVKDWDFATSAEPSEILRVFKDGYYNNIFGTVGVPIEVDGKKQVLEITTFRTEGAYRDRRRPEEVKWGKTIEEDLARRDFTINAIAIDIENGKHQTVDPYEGQEDLKLKLVRAVGDPKLRFKEDALRLMRAVRIANELSFAIEEQTLREIKSDSKLLSEIAKERVRDELLRILSSKNPYEGILLLKEAGLLERIIPELLGGEGISQKRPGRHHTEDVLTHNLLSLKHCPSTDPLVRFAALLHDVGKPKAAGKDDKGLITFYNHEVVGAKIAKEICESLRLSKKETEKVVTLIRWHMFSVDERITDAAVRRFIRRIGIQNVADMMDLRIGDRLGGGTQTAESWRLKKFKERVAGELAPKPFSIEDMAVDGNDVMKELKIKPGPKVGEILQKLFEEVDEDLSRNNKEYLLKRISEIAKDSLLSSLKD